MGIILHAINSVSACRHNCNTKQQLRTIVSVLHAKHLILSRLIWIPLKLVPPRNEFFWNILTHSEKFVPTIGQPQERKSVTTKDISGVQSCISRKLNDCFSWVCLSGPTQRSKCAFVANFAQCTRKLSVACGREWDYSTLCAAELTGLSSFLKSPYIRHWSKFCKWNMFQGLHYFISGRWSKFFRGSPYFAVK